MTAIRQRLPVALSGAVSLVVAIVVAIVVAVVVLASGEPPPATGASNVVPSDALAYLHLSTDSGRPAVKRAKTTASRFPDYPLLEAGILQRLSAIVSGGRSLALASQIRPWLGNEAALALLNTPTTTASSLLVLDVRDQTRARSFVLRSGAVSAGHYRGTQLLGYRNGTELAFVSHYLVLGQDSSVRAAIDVDSGHVPSLAASAPYQRAASGERDDRVLDAYVSVAGVRRLLASRGGVLGVLGVLLYQPALAGATISVSASSGGARVEIHTALDPNLARVQGSPRAQFAPTLQGVLPSSAALLLDVAALDREAPRILSAGATGGVGANIGPLLHRLGAALTAEGINVQPVVSIFHGETAVAIAQHGGAPSLVIVTRTTHQSQTRDTLAALEAPLAQLFPAPSSGSGQAPLFNDVQVAGVTAHQLVLAPGLQLDYAVFDGLVVVSTSVDGIAAVASHPHPLGDTKLFTETLSDRPDQVSSLVFLDFSQLLSLGEQTGLMRGARLRALRPDLERIRAAGLHSTSGEADSNAELFLKIS